jgi:hypothetical protein
MLVTSDFEISEMGEPMVSVDCAKIADHVGTVAHPMQRVLDSILFGCTVEMAAYSCTLLSKIL